MAKTAFEQKSLNIRIKRGERVFALPYATSDTRPTFKWDVPAGVSQNSFIVELRTFYPVKLTTGETMCAYFSSSEITSAKPEYKLAESLNPNTWAGLCEIRITVLDSEGNKYCSHDETDNIYNFERNKPQGKAWGINDDTCYFVFDTTINSFINQNPISYRFKKSTDVNTEQSLTYDFQVSETPLFGEGKQKNTTYERTGMTISAMDVQAVINGAFQLEKNEEELADVTLESLKSNKMYFFRARAYDGYDYSDWSIVNAFCNFLNNPPIPKIITVQTVVDRDKFVDRPNGEVKIRAKVTDDDNEYVSVAFFFSMRCTQDEANRLGCEANLSDDVVDYETEMAKEGINKLLPCGLSENITKIPTNKEIEFTWISGRQIKNTKKISVYLYMVAFDEYAEARDVAGPFIVDNSVIGDENAAVGTSPESFYLRGQYGRCLWYPVLPIESRQTILTERRARDKNAKKSVTNAWAEWYDFWSSDTYIGYRGGLGTYTIYCPECNNMNILTMSKPANKDYFIFTCPECHKEYPQDIVFGNMHFSGSMKYMKDCYALYHGYNSNISKDRYLTESLMLMRSKEFEKYKEEIEEKTGEEYSGKKFVELTELKDNSISGSSYSQSGGWGILGEDVLVNLEERPDIEPYYWLHCPKTKVKHHAVYMDGPGLKMSIDDYMHDFEGSSNEMTGDSKPGDPAMEALAKQKPWSIFYQLNQIYTGGGDSNGGNDGNKSQDIYGSDNNCIEYETISMPAIENGSSVITKYKTNLWWLPCETIKTYFSISIKRDFNDKYRLKVDDTVYEGSVLDDDAEAVFVEYPYTKDSWNYWNRNENMNKYINMLNRVFGGAFESVTEYDSRRLDRLVENNPDERYISIRVICRKSKDIHKVELLSVTDDEGNDISCYKALGINYFTSTVSKMTFPGQFGQTVTLGKVGEGSDERFYMESGNSSSNNKNENVSESPVDNDLDFTNTTVTGEPLFTCFKDKVNQNGYHFKFNEEDFKKSGKIYIRTYRLENALPFKDPKYGYRDWIVVPTDEDGVYTKKKVLNTRGIPASYKKILVKDGEYTKEANALCDPITGAILSHKEPETKEGEEQPDPIIYEPQTSYQWRNKLFPKKCCVFEYVEMSEAFTKNYLDFESGRNPFNKKTPVHIFGDIDKIRYGIYVMGQYALTKNQEKYNLYQRTPITDDTNDCKFNQYGFTKIGDFNSDALKGEKRTLSCLAFEDYESYLCPKCNNGNISVGSKKFNKQYLVCDDCGYEFEKPRKQLDNVSQDTFNRYKENWLDDYNPEAQSTNDFAALIVDQFSPRFTAKTGIYKKYGYEPTHCVEPYWKKDEDNIYNESYIPNNTRYVHGINYDDFANYRLINRYVLEKKLISSVSFTTDDEDTVRVEGIDYRLRGKNIYDEKYYFSGLPKSEHEAYSTRPDVVYPYDRPWRILGEIFDAKIYTKWAFVYLQSVWNSYNRVYWQAAQDENTYLCLYAADVTDNSTTEKFSVKTKRSIWVNTFNAWCIPYLQDEDSDMIDTINNDKFQNGRKYQFSLKAINKYNGNVSGTEITSLKFTTSNDAISPATIVSTDYDPWTKKLTIKFRFDDVLGRTYDITGFQYSTADPDIANGESTDGYWQDALLTVLNGKLEGLASNKQGDNVPNKNMIIYHTISLNVGNLQGVTITDELRVRILSELALDREGFTLPVFYAKMWANEFLNPAEKAIVQLEGSKNRWVWKDTVNEETGEVESGWTYVPEDEAVYMPGKIQSTQSEIDAIDEKFESWYCTVGKFKTPDMDAFEHYVKNTTDTWNDLYYTSIFSSYLTAKNLTAAYTVYVSQYTNPVVLRVQQNFLAKNSLKKDYENFYKQNRFNYLLAYLKRKNLKDRFLTWFNSNKIKPEDTLYESFITDNSLTDKYNAYWKDKTTTLTENEKRAEYINAEQKSAFQNYYEEKNLYIDTRYDERSNKVDTAGFATWMLNPVDKDGNAVTFDYLNANTDYTGDQYYLYLQTLNKEYVSNAGKTEARIGFMQAKNKGVSYSQQYQSLKSDITTYQNQLKAAYNTKAECETDHRKNLIAQGYFSNGFQDNVPYKSDGTTNVCFRFRVETQIYEGKKSDYITATMYDVESAEEGESVDTSNGYQERFSMYYRFQLDFYDTFNSQSGQKPLRDVLFTYDADGTPYRIEATTADADMSAATTSESRFEEEETQKTTSSLTDYQKSAEWSIPKADLPGEHSTDELPYYWSANSSFDHLYFWRVAPYNVLERPVFETMLGSTKSIFNDTTSFTANNIQDKNGSYHNSVTLKKHSAVLTNIFGNAEIINTNITRDRFTGWYFTHNAFYIWCATAKLAKPIWKKNVESNAETSTLEGNVTYPLLQEHPYDNSWVNTNIISRGQVQFLTDRPRQIEDITDENENVTGHTVSFIEDNIKNYETVWIPFNVNRTKPSVLRESNQYLMFTNKKLGSGKVSGNAYDMNVITMSRGFASDIFGEECITFPRYTTQTPASVIDGALSFENPCIIKTGDVYYLYFNVLFFNKQSNAFHTKVYRAESLNLDDWYDIRPCMFKANADDLTDKNNIGDVNIVYHPAQTVDESTTTPESFDCYAVSKESGDSVANIHKWVSSDGLTFVYNKLICDELYAKSRPCYVNHNGTEKLFFSMTNRSGNCSMIFSLNLGDETPYPEIEKGTGNWDSGTFGTNDRFVNPCVLMDTDFGCPVLRLFYNTTAPAYLYKNKQLELTEYQDTVINTEYLEEFSSWEKTDVRNWLNGDNKVNGELIVPCEYSTDLQNWKDFGFNNDTASSLRYPANTSYLRFNWVSEQDTVYAVKLYTYAVNNAITSLSQGPWIDFSNISETEAVIKPEENTDLGYDVNDYAASSYIVDAKLTESYNEWYSALEDKTKYEDNDELAATDFLLETFKYPAYLKWSRKGPGIYRYLKLVKQYKYNGE